jgi:hypothetical protein
LRCLAANCHQPAPGALLDDLKPLCLLVRNRGTRAAYSSPGEVPMASQAVVTREEDVWVIRVENTNGKVQEYRCATEVQARQLAAVLSAQERPARP